MDFPFTDSIKFLIKMGVESLLNQADQLMIKNCLFAIKNKISLYFIKNRLFKH